MNSPVEIACIEVEQIAFFRMRPAKRLNTVFMQAGVEFSLIHPEPRTETHESGSEESTEQRGEQQSQQVPQKARVPHVRGHLFY